MSLWSETHNKARYGGKTWILWKDKAGKQIAERETKEAIKRALLDVGTQGIYWIIDRQGAMIADWSIGCNHFRQLKRGS